MDSNLGGFCFDDWLVSIGQEIMLNGWKTNNIPETVKDWFSGKVLRALPPRLIQKFIGFLLDNRDIDGSIALREMNDEEFHILIYKSEKTRLRREKDEAAERQKLANMANNPTPQNLAYIQHRQTEMERIEERKNHTLIFDEDYNNGTTETGLKFFCDEVIPDPLNKKEEQLKTEIKQQKISKIQNNPPSCDILSNSTDLDSDEEYQLGRKIKKRKITENKCVCETCGKGFANNYRLNRHIRQVHENPKSNYTPRKDGPSEKQQALECQDIFFDESTAKWVCRLCGKQITRPGHMMRHVNQVHYKTICCSCDICGMEFTDKNKTG